MRVRRDLLLVVGIPLTLVLGVQLILALTIPQQQLQEELTLYQVDYTPTQFTLTKVEVGYVNQHTLKVDFKVTGGDGSTDLVFKAVCQDLDHNPLVAQEEGLLELALGDGSSANNTLLTPGQKVSGSILWADMPSGEQTISLRVWLTDIYLDTWTFFVELREA